MTDTTRRRPSPRRALLAAAAIAASVTAVLTAPGSAVAGGLEPLLVAPYERVEINDANVMGLLPEGRQNFVVSEPASFEEDIEAAKQRPANGIRPNSISSSVAREDGMTTLVYGAWRLDEIPSEIVVYPEGEDWGYGAQLVVLEDEPGWGTYYFDASRYQDERLGELTIVAYDENHEVFDEIEIDRPWF
ncbi:hypothetical protein [Streptomyces mayteni]